MYAATYMHPYMCSGLLHVQCGNGRVVEKLQIRSYSTFDFVCISKSM